MFLFARMGRRRDDDRTAARHRHQSLQLGGIRGRSRHIELQIARGNDVAAAERGEALRIDIRLGEADVEPAKQRGDRGGNPAPARERAMRHPAVDQDHRQPPRRARQDQVGPQIGFDEQRQRRPPVIEKARDIARGIVRHILMDDICGKPLGDDRGRSHRARGQEDADIERAQLLDQSRRGQHFADAGAVNPDQRSVRPDVAAHAAAFADPGRILLALFQPPLDQRRRQRHHGHRQPPVEAQRHRQGVSHDPPVPDDRPAHRPAGSLRSGWPPVPPAVFPWSRHRHPAAQ